MKRHALDTSQFLTATDVAHEIGLCPRTVAKLIKAGRMPGYDVGNKYRIPVAAWELYKAGRWQPPAPVPTAMPAPEMLKRRAS